MPKANHENEILIFEFISNPKFRIHRSGVIERKVGRSWKPTGTVDKSRGYRIIKYKGTNLKAHRIVYAKFAGLLQAEMVVNHIDGNKTNNSFENLELVSESANRIHAYRVLGHNPNRGNAKVPWEKVDSIRADRAGGMKLHELQDKYCISKTSLHYICAGKTYREDLKNDAN